VIRNAAAMTLSLKPVLRGEGVSNSKCKLHKSKHRRIMFCYEDCNDSIAKIQQMRNEIKINCISTGLL